jgi:hypothetical protein
MNKSANTMFRLGMDLTNVKKGEVASAYYLRGGKQCLVLVSKSQNVDEMCAYLGAGLSDALVRITLQLSGREEDVPKEMVEEYVNLLSMVLTHHISNSYNALMEYFTSSGVEKDLADYRLERLMGDLIDDWEGI